ncbi:MAG: hypothetical protein NC123_18550 [Butyrivibrio sp.]|nr:hypothetical protein [Butyrivibrio sp.]
MEKAYNRQYFSNDTAPELSDDNLNQMDAALDMIDNRMIEMHTGLRSSLEAEKIRVSNEKRREAFETERQKAEAERITAEAGRKQSEIERENAEAGRIANEYARMEQGRECEQAIERAKDAASGADEAAYRCESAIETAENYESDAKNYCVAAESMVHGGTGTREGEDDDNAGYYYRKAKECSEQSEKEADRAKSEADRARDITGTGIATAEKAGLVKPDGTTITVDEYGTIRTNTGYSLSLSMDPVTYKMTISLLDNTGKTVSSQEIDFPLESMVVGAQYSAGTKKLILTLQNGHTLEVDISSIISGLVNNTFTIAGIDMKDNITVNELRSALKIDKVDNTPDLEKQVYYAARAEEAGADIYGRFIHDFYAANADVGVYGQSFSIYYPIVSSGYVVKKQEETVRSLLNAIRELQENYYPIFEDLYKKAKNSLVLHYYARTYGIGTTAETFELDYDSVYLIIVATYNATNGAVRGMTARLIASPDNINSTANCTILNLGVTSNTDFTITAGNFKVSVKANSASYNADAVIYLVV